MKLVLFATLATVALAAPDFNGYQAPEQTYIVPDQSFRQETISVAEQIPILRDDRVQEETGHYNFDVETANGIIMSQSGSPDGPEGSVVKTGEYSYTAPDGTPVHIRFVADGNGFQPEGDVLPVAPEFPHPIPDFVLRQIEKAREEDAAAARSGSASVRSDTSAPAPSLYYSSPE
ncbi:hypothetical protein Pmani_003010 [Petrolisthes manimaculis]|uniref:Uncharacterized protein n=1 Tax=Petrolisthes manimaculis TaxID=1843537 RepID=A0AAE1QGH4_9EUCA|nr:hypothetical protein Pmani_003010 [Petrolisthes manimaculis]